MSSSKVAYLWCGRGRSRRWESCPCLGTGCRIASIASFLLSGQARCRRGETGRLLDPYTVRSDKRGGRRPTDAWESELGKARTSHGHGLFVRADADDDCLVAEGLDNILDIAGFGFTNSGTF